MFKGGVYKGRPTGAFTLVELLVVIAIIAILAAVALPVYAKYQQKSKVASFALPISNACARDIVAYCISLGVETSQTMDVSSLDLQNCNITKVPDYNITVDILGTFTCEPSGVVSGGTVDAKLQGIDSYKARCELDNNGIECSVISN